MQQLEAIVAAIDTVTNTNKSCIIISGVGGSGKSTVVEHITAQLQLRQRHIHNTRNLATSSAHDTNYVMVLAPTGAAASVINGITIHSAFAFSTQSTDSWFHEPPEATKEALQVTWDTIEYIILDEVSMVSPTMLEGMNFRLR